MTTHRQNYAIAIGLLSFMSIGWLLGLFTGVVPAYSPPVAALLGACGVLSSTIALLRGFGGPSVWLRVTLVAGLCAAVAGFAGGICFTVAEICGTTTP